ncbi:hypothetical protein [Bradyrhizobium sp.]
MNEFPKVTYTKIEDSRYWAWCTVHKRNATHVRNTDGKLHCDPALGGIMLPCDTIAFVEPMYFVRLPTESREQFEERKRKWESKNLVEYASGKR